MGPIAAATAWHQDNGYYCTIMRMARKRDGLESSAEERILLLQKGLDRKADAACKEWWEGYLKNVISFRGVKIADIRAVMHMWISDHHVDQLTVARQRDLALRLIRQTFSEDKMAGILFLQEVLVPNHAIRYKGDLSRFASLFTDGHIFDWNTCDWFCVKVLGPLAARQGEPCARAISRWKTSKNLWQQPRCRRRLRQPCRPWRRILRRIHRNAAGNLRPHRGVSGALCTNRHRMGIAGAQCYRTGARDRLRRN